MKPVKSNQLKQIQPIQFKQPEQPIQITDLTDIIERLDYKNYLFEVSLPNGEKGGKYTHYAIKNLCGSLENYLKKIVKPNEKEDIRINLYAKNGSSFLRKGSFKYNVWKLKPSHEPTRQIQSNESIQTNEPTKQIQSNETNESNLSYETILSNEITLILQLNEIKEQLEYTSDVFEVSLPCGKKCGKFTLVDITDLFGSIEMYLQKIAKSYKQESIQINLYAKNGNVFRKKSCVNLTVMLSSHSIESTEPKKQIQKNRPTEPSRPTRTPFETVPLRPKFLDTIMERIKSKNFGVPDSLSNEKNVTNSNGVSVGFFIMM